MLATSNVASKSKWGQARRGNDLSLVIIIDARPHVCQGGRCEFRHYFAH